METVNEALKDDYTQHENDISAAISILPGDLYYHT